VESAKRRAGGVKGGGGMEVAEGKESKGGKGGMGG